MRSGLLLLGLAGCWNHEVAPGTHARTVRHGGTERRYQLTVPAGTTGRIPAVIVLHGAGGSADKIAENTGMKSIGAREGFAVLTPQGLRAGGTVAGWNAGGCCAGPAETNVDDVGFLGAMLDDAVGAACLDEERIHALGHSNGGMMAWRLACDLDDRIASVATSAGVLLDAQAGAQTPFRCKAEEPVAVLAMHGLADECVAYEGGKSAGPGGMVFPAALDGLERWRKHNGCGGPPVEVFQKGGARCVQWPGCAEKVELCTVEELGHGWPGGSYPRLTRQWCGGEASADLPGSERAWDFFEANPRRRALR